MFQPARRQRALRACDECKRKKKQCTGTNPCVACTRRGVQCRFAGVDPSRNGGRVGETDTNRSPSKRPRLSPRSEYDIPEDSLTSAELGLPNDHSEDDLPLHNFGRLLQDSQGRLLYVGDSASLSFLQSIRILVESHLGPSPFTIDSSRHMILEASLSIPSSYRHTLALPDIQVARFLSNSFFTNTAGLCDIFNRETFTTNLEETYTYPLEADAQWLCQLNLVFAIGLQMCSESSLQSLHAGKISRLDSSGAKRAEIFYLAARQLKDPVAAIEDGGIAVVQSLLLMTIFMLVSSKRNTAWWFTGMAVNLAYALGIHKEETFAMFNEVEKTARRNTWQSLYVMDCFLAASLGRPNTISFASASALSRGPLPGTTGLLAAVKVSTIIGDILSSVYQKRKASRSVAYMLSLRFSRWLKELPDELHWQRITTENSDTAFELNRLHLNLIYFHGIILLTRPFFQFEVSKQLRKGQNGATSDAVDKSNAGSQAKGAGPEKSFCFHGACVTSATRSIVAIHAAFSSGVLPKRDAFVIYWLFSATLILLTNIFCPVYSEPEGESTVIMALELIRFHGDTDPQAQRYQTILESFNDVLQAAKKSKQGAYVNQGNENLFTALFGTNSDQTASENNFQDSRPQMATGMNLVSDNWTVRRAEDVYGGQVPLTVQSTLPEMNPITQESFDTSGLAGYELDDSINFDGMWWSDSRETFADASYIPVPLYGLLEQS